MPCEDRRGNEVRDLLGGLEMAGEPLIGPPGPLGIELTRQVIDALPHVADQLVPADLARLGVGRRPPKSLDDLVEEDAMAAPRLLVLERLLALRATEQDRRVARQPADQLITRERPFAQTPIRVGVVTAGIDEEQVRPSLVVQPLHQTGQADHRRAFADNRVERAEKGVAEPPPLGIPDQVSSLVLQRQLHAVPGKGHHDDILLWPLQKTGEGLFDVHLGGVRAGQRPDGELLLLEHDSQLLDVALGEPQRTVLQLAPIRSC